MKIPPVNSLFLTGLLISAFTCTNPSESDNKPTGTDTTSHNFTWQIDTIGYRNASLADGVIINENDMWVVGEIYPDSASYKDAIAYGAAHWDGMKWTPEKVVARWFHDNPDIKSQVRIGGIVQTDDGSLFISSGLVLMKRENSSWIEKGLDIIDGKGFQKIWGIKSDDIYIYGVNGGLYHYNGSSLTLIPTNTTLDIMDMQGDYNPYTKEYELLALASTDYSHLNGSKLLKIKNKSVTELSVKGINNYSKEKLWFYQGSNYWIVGDGEYFKQSLSDSIWNRKSDHPSSNWVANDINGWNPNDILLALGDGHILHYNGSNWKDFKNELKLNNVSIGKIIIKNDLVLLLGVTYDGKFKGIIIRGIRIR